MTLAEFPAQNRPDRAVISIGGDDALTWLNSLVTMDVSTLPAGSAAYGALLNPQGKILHDMFVYNAGTWLLIDCVAGQRAALLQKLALYRLRAKLQIELDNNLEVGVHLEKPDDHFCYRDPRHPDMGWRSFSAVGTFINAPASFGYDLRRIGLGLADGQGDIGVETTFPHEANFDQFGGVSFLKGCYVGQEVVSRMQHRSTARSRMLPVTLTGPVPASGRNIVSGEKVIGQILSSVAGQALALLRLDRLADAPAPLLADGAVVRVARPDWIKYDVVIPEAVR